MRRPLLLVFVGVLVGLVALSGIVLWRASSSAEELAPSVSELLADRLGGSVQADSVEVQGVGRVVLRGVRHAAPVAGARGRVEVDELVLNPRLLGLVGGRLELESAEIRGARIAIDGRPETPPAQPLAAPPPTTARTTPPTPRPTPPPAPKAERVELATDRLLVRDAALVVRDGGGREELAVDGLALQLDDVLFSSQTGPTGSSPSLLGSLGALRAGAGELSADIARSPVGIARDLSASVEMRDGTLLLEGLSYRSTVGDVTGRAAVDLTRRTPRHETELAFDRLDLGALVGVAGDAPTSRAALSVTARGVGTDPSSLEGSGQLDVESGRLPRFPVLSRIESSLQRVSLRDTVHQPVVARFQLADGALDFEPFVVYADDFQLDVAGRIGLDGRLDLTVVLEGAPSRVDLRRVPDVVVDALVVAPDRVVFPIRVAGTATEPVVRPDVDAIVSSARDAGRTIDEAELRRAMAELFGA